MSVALQIGMAIGSVGVLFGIMSLVRHIAPRLQLSDEVQRKLIHVATGLYALSLPWLFADRWPVYLLLGLAILAMGFLRYAKISRGLGETLHGVKRNSYGDYMLVVGVGLCFFLSEGDALSYILPIAVLTLSDAAAAVAGTAFGRSWFRVESGQKSIEGSVTFFVVTLLISVFCLTVLADLPIANNLVLALMVAAFGTLVEAQSWRGFDNLFLPLALLIFLSENKDENLIELAVLTALFMAAMLGLLTIGPRFGLTRHACRVYVVAIFLIFAVTEPQHAIMPVLVLVAHAWANAKSPADDSFPDLDIVASLGFFSFGWLAVGNATGWTAVAHYNLTALGLAMGLSVVALKARIIAVFAVGALLFALRAATVSLDSAASDWPEPLLLEAALCVTFVAGVTLLAPAHLARDRVLKLTLVALLLPAGSYTFSVAARLGFSFTPGTQP